MGRARSRSRTRRARLVFGVGTAVALAASAVAFAAGPSASAFVGADPYPVAEVVDTNPDPDVVETTLVAEEATVDIGNGVSAHVWTFNGTVPGPEFRLTVGDRVIVHFENELQEPTGIHWHGIELSNRTDGTPLTQNQVPTGGEFVYDFVVTRPGIYWYHPHHHSSTNQVFRGLYGSIVVTDDEGHESTLVDDGVLPGPENTKSLVLSDVTVCEAGPDDTDTYDDSLPWVGGPVLPPQAGPSPATLCDTPIDHHGVPIVDGANNPVPLAAGEVPNIQPAGTMGRVNEGRTVLANGVNAGHRAGSPEAPGSLAATAKTMGVEAGEGVRLQAVNTATTRYFRLRLTDASGGEVPLVRVGGEGGLLDNAIIEGGTPDGFDTGYSVGEIVLGPGDRADVVAALPAAATGVLTLWTEDYIRTGPNPPPGFPHIPTVPVMHFEVMGTAADVYTIAAGTPLLADPSVNAPVEALGAPTSSLLDPASFSPVKLGMATADIQLTATGTALAINGEIGSHDAPGDYTTIDHFKSGRFAEAGEVIELTVTNKTQAHHPFHLHGFSLQPLSFTPDPDAVAPVPTASYTFDYREFMDNIDIPPKYVLTFRIRTDERPQSDGITPGGADGRWVMHCHIFFHATNGMISELTVGDTDGNERPYVDADSTTVAVDEGTLALRSGTLADFDQDAVTLSASEGTATNNNDGTWTWTHTPLDGPADSVVYVTGSDPQGNTGQTSFGLTVANVAPNVLSMTVPTGPVALGTAVSVSALFNDFGMGDTHTAEFDWGDGTTSAAVVAGEFGSGTAFGDHTYTEIGAFTVSVTVTDDDGASGTDSAATPILVFPVMNARAYGGRIRIGPAVTVLGDTGTITTSGSQSVTRQAVTATIGPVKTGTLSGEVTFTVVPSDPAGSTATATGRATQVTVDLLPFGLARLKILGVQATSTTTCSAATGTTTISSITLNGIPVLPSTRPAPNTTVNLGLARLDLNLQTVGPDGLTVTGVRVAAGSIDLALGYARSAIDCGAPATLSSTLARVPRAGRSASVSVAALTPAPVSVPASAERPPVFCRLPV